HDKHRNRLDGCYITRAWRVPFLIRRYCSVQHSWSGYRIHRYQHLRRRFNGRNRSSLSRILRGRFYRRNIIEVKAVLIDTDNEHLSVLYGEDCEYFMKLEDVKCVTTKGVEITYA